MVKNFKEFMAEKGPTRALQAEFTAFNKVLKLTNGHSFQSPAGADAGFPDFGITIELNSGKLIDVHIEYKDDASAQMGSMRDWIYERGKFYSKDTDSNSKRELLTIMNASNKALSNGERLLSDLKQYASSKVDKLHRGALNHIDDKAERHAALKNFAEKTRDFQLAKIQDASLGKKIIDHYRMKFKKNMRAKANGHLLLMMIEDKVWMMDKKNVGRDEITEVANRFGIKGFDTLKNLVAKLEVRIQPRGLKSGKKASIDVMASYRLKGKPSGGHKIV